MAHDHDHDVTDDDFEYEDVDIKEALGLPDALPPIRLLPLPALAEWVGKEGREVDESGDLTPDGLAAATAALGVDADELAFLWECALGVEWLVFDEDEDRVTPGETADAWASGGDEPVFAAWALTLSAVLGETLEFYGPEVDAAEADEDDEPEFDFA